MQGNVKQVISGDTIIIIGGATKGPPPEKLVTLASIQAPSVAVKTSTREVSDEPYGWEARELLRKLIIGKTVEFKIEYQNNGQEFATVKYQNETVSKPLLRNGLAILKTTNPTSDYNELLEEQNKAIAEKLNLHSDNDDMGKKTIRKIKYWDSPDFDVEKFVKNHRGEKIAGIVENVKDGSSLSVFLPPHNVYLNILLSGVVADGWKYNPSTSTEVAEPFAAEARHNVQIRVLNRDLDIRIEGIDEYSTVYASIYHPKGNISLYLLKQGFAKVLDSSIKYAESAAQIREAQKEAQQNQLRKWRDSAMNYVEGTIPGAKIMEIVSPDCIIIMDKARNERKIFLASIRCAKPARKNAREEPWSFAAREMLRLRTLGKSVRVVMEYSREVQPSLTANPNNDGPLYFASLYVDNKSINEMLVEEGLANVQKHRAEEDRACNYDDLVAAEERAKKSKKGLHSGVDDRFLINDLVGPDNVKKAKSLADTLIRKKNLTGIVEFIFNGGRFKLRLPTESLIISFTLGGVRVPQNTRGGKEVSEAFAQESTNYARHIILNHEVSIIVENADRGGNFMGNLFYDKTKNLAEELLELGLARMMEYTNNDKYSRAEARARESRLGVWSNESAHIEDEGPKVVDEVIRECIVSHVEDAAHICIQIHPNDKLKMIKESLTKDSGFEMQIRNGSIVTARWRDNALYRGRILKKMQNSYSVKFIDFGNIDIVKEEDIRKCPAEICSIPPQARMCKLSGVREYEDVATDCIRQIHHLTEGILLRATVELISDNISHVILITLEEADNSSTPVSIQEDLVAQGLLRFDRKALKIIFIYIYMQM
eukprot:GHVL01001775.1.p1 GENE.GHVL01001775.1~~GHVL01001775.1.p1  ORF type:complete len:825 (+),score=170.20 GHVL01001775.1:54-2528(+)